MYREIIKAISTALYEEFGKEYHYYAQSIAQGWKEPCFFILPIKQEEQKKVGQRYYSKNLFDIHYFAEKQGDGLELQSVLERLYSCLELISVEKSLIRSTNNNVQTVDGVLHFIIEYNLFLFRPKNKDVYMEGLEVYGRTEKRKQIYERTMVGQ